MVCLGGAGREPVFLWSSRLAFLTSLGCGTHLRQRAWRMADMGGLWEALGFCRSRREGEATQS